MTREIKFYKNYFIDAAKSLVSNKKTVIHGDFSPKNILIDDRIDNINGWRELGGIGIHHVSTKHTIDQLKVLGL